MINVPHLTILGCGSARRRCLHMYLVIPNPETDISVISYTKAELLMRHNDSAAID
jgi:hypothetical protein